MGFHFEAAGFLFCLAAALIPILMLLIKAKTRERVVFSSILFFKAITLTSNRRLEWKRLLLLFLRIGALILLALAFSRPYTMDFTGKSLSDVKQWVFLLDRSASMQMREDGITAFERAKKIIAQRVKNKPTASMSLYVFDRQIHSVLTDEKSPKKFLEALQGLEAVDSQSDFAMLGREIPTLCGESMKGVRCAVLSDFLADQEGLDELTGSSRKEMLQKTSVEWVSVGPAQFENFFIRKLLLPPRPFILGRDESIRFSYGSFDGFQKNKTVTLYINDKKVSSLRLDLSQSSSGEASFTHVFPEQGIVKLRLQAEADNLSQDDYWEEMVWVRKGIEILLVTDHETEHPFESPDFYLTQALLSADAEEENHAWVRFYRRSTEELSNEALSAYDFVILSEIRQISADLAQQVEAYVRRGGTAVYFASPQSGLGSRNTMSPREEKLIEGRMQDLEKVSPKAPRFLGPVDYDLPLFKAFESGQQGELERIRVYRFRPFIPSKDSNQKVLLRLENRWPILTERALEKGRLFVWTLGWTPYWSQLPKDPLFVPLVLEFLKYAGNPEGVITHYSDAGMPIRISALESAQHPRIEFSMPGGIERTLFAGPGNTFTVEETSSAGRYGWSNEHQYHQYVVTMPTEESGAADFGTLKVPEERDFSIMDNASDKAEATPFMSKVFVTTACLTGLLMLLMLESLSQVSLYRTESGL